MKKISKYLLLTITLSFMMFIGSDVVKAKILQEAVDKTTDAYASFNAGEHGMTSGGEVDCDSVGCFLYKPGIRVSIVDTNGNMVSARYMDYADWTLKGTAQNVKYLPDIKTELLNGDDANTISVNLYTGTANFKQTSKIPGTSISVTPREGGTITYNLYDVLVDFYEKEGLGKTHPLFEELGYTLDLEKSKDHYVLLEPLYYVIIGGRESDNSEEKGLAYQYVGTTTALAKYIETNGEITIKGWPCTFDSGQKYCATGLYGDGFFTKDAISSLILQDATINNRPGESNDYKLNSLGTKYSYFGSKAVSIEKYQTPTIYSHYSFNGSVNGFAMNIIWLDLLIKDIEKDKPFDPKNCDDEEYIRNYYNLSINGATNNGNQNEEEKLDETIYCCDDKYTKYKEIYIEKFGEETWNNNYNQYCSFGECKYTKGDPFDQNCCYDSSYIAKYIEGTKETNVYSKYCSSKLKSVCNPIADSGSCDTDDQANFRDCAAPTSADYMKYDEASKSWSTWNDYFFDTDTNGEYRQTITDYCELWCQEIISTNFDTAPTLYVGEVNESGELTDLLAGTFFTWEASIDGLVECRNKVDWGSFFTPFNSKADEISNEFDTWVANGKKCDDGKNDWFTKNCGEGVGYNPTRGVNDLPIEDFYRMSGYFEEYDDALKACNNLTKQEKAGSRATDCEIESYNDCDTEYYCNGEKVGYSTYSNCDGEEDTRYTKQVNCEWEYRYKIKLYKENETCRDYQNHCGQGETADDDFSFRKYDELVKEQHDIYKKVSACFNVPSSSNEANISYSYELNGSSYDVTLEKGETKENTYIGHWVDRTDGRVFGETYGYYIRANQSSSEYIGDAKPLHYSVRIDDSTGERSEVLERVDFDSCTKLTNSHFQNSISKCEEAASNLDGGWRFYKENALFTSYSTLYKLPSNYNTEITSDGLHISGIDNGDSSGSLYIDFSNLKVPIATVTGTYDFNINYSGFGEKFDKKMNNDGSGQYVCKLDVKNEFLVDNEDPDPDEPCEGEGCELDLSTGDIKVIYRPIDLEDPFPGLDGTGRTTGANWCHLQLGDKIINSEEYENCDYLLRNYSNWYWAKYDCSNTNQIVSRFILNNRGVDGKKLYSEREPLYTIRLTPSIIKEIRKEYRTFDYTSRDDYIYEVDGDGTGGYLSLFINKYYQRMVDNERVIECLSGDEIFGDPDHYNRYWNSCFTGGVFK